MLSEVICPYALLGEIAQLFPDFEVQLRAKRFSEPMLSFELLRPAGLGQELTTGFFVNAPADLPVAAVPKFLELLWNSASRCPSKLIFTTFCSTPISTCVEIKTLLSEGMWVTKWKTSDVRL